VPHTGTARRAATTYDRGNEDPAERLDRNYGELLQELRVAQTGVQVLFAFLLGIAFQQRFQSLEWYQRGFYLVTLTSSALAAVLLIAPAAIHRMLFRRRLKDELVMLTSRLAATGLAVLAIAISSALLFVLDVVINLGVALAIVIPLLAVIGVIWLLIPVRIRRHHPGSLIDGGTKLDQD
jgi:hypothetical protein